MADKLNYRIIGLTRNDNTEPVPDDSRENLYKALVQSPHARESTYLGRRVFIFVWITAGI